MVAQTSNLTQAAKQLFTTPPAVSAHIKALETELKTTLFIRTSKGMTLTEKGKLLLVDAQKTLDCASQLLNTAATNQELISGHFKLGCNQSPRHLKTLLLINNLQKNNTSIVLDISSMPTGLIIKAIRSGEIDGGYIYGAVPDDFESIALIRQHITTIAPADLVTQTTLAPNFFANQPWITMGHDCPFDQQLTSVLGHNILTVASSNDDKSRLELVKSGLGLSFLEHQAAIEHHSNGEIALLNQLDFELDLHFVIVRKRKKEPVIDTVFSQIKIIWQC